MEDIQKKIVKSFFLIFLPAVLGRPDKTFEMFDIRLQSSSVVLLNNSKLWVTGGISCYGHMNMSDRQRKSTEFISKDRPPVKGPECLFTLFVYLYSAVCLLFRPRSAICYF